MKKIKISSFLAAICVICCSCAAKDNALYKFDFGSGKVKSGYTQVDTTAYSAERGFGLDFGTTANAVTRSSGDALSSDLLTSDQPFYFSVTMPEGNYKVTMTFGDMEQATATLVKVESRRLMLETVKTEPGEFVTREIMVNVRTPKINEEQSVKLNSREHGKLDWDDKLTIEFNGPKPAISSMIIENAPDSTVTVFLTGDSTVVDQDSEPWNSWGQMITNFFDTGVSVANYAESGQSLGSSISSRRLAKAVSQMKEGDYLFIQFGHNDMKQKGEGKGPWESYTNELKIYVKAAREKGATPVLITQMHRRRFDEEGKVQNSHGEYPDAVRKVAADENVALIDLNNMSVEFYEALGPEGSAAAFQDGTHHNNYGSYELAKCVILGLTETGLPLAKHVSPNFGTYNPAQPDDPGAFYMPASPRYSMEKPLGD